VCYLYDPLGNVVQRLDSSGNVLSTNAYDAYGNLLAGVGSDPNGYAGVDPYGYKGQYGYYTDHETGLILCTHRYYDPTVGRWLTRDKLGYDGGINLYGYCGGDPVGGVDPSGTASSSAVKNAFTAGKDGGLFLAGIAAEIPIEIYDNAKHQFLSGEMGNSAKMAWDLLQEIRNEWVEYDIHDTETFKYWILDKVCDTAESLDIVNAINAGDYFEAGRCFTRCVLAALTIEAGGEAALGEGASIGERFAALDDDAGLANARAVGADIYRGEKLPEELQAKGFRKIKQRLHGEPIYTNGKYYISPDADMHNGGAYKMAKSVEALGRKTTRIGTYDKNLNKIGR
jgi:RHS repeat-associated protein